MTIFDISEFVILIVVIALFIAYVLIFIWGFCLHLKDRKKAKEIMNNGGPKTFKEYLLFFPDACRLCGSIEFFTATWEGETLHSGPDYSGSDPGYATGTYYQKYFEKQTLKYCARCGDEKIGIFNKHKNRVRARFLTKEESKAIPNCPDIRESDTKSSPIIISSQIESLERWVEP